MAPKKGTKRTAAAAAVDVEAVAAAKKLKESLKKHGVSKTLYDGVVEALQHPLAAAHAPQSARDMLIAGLVEGMCVPAAERHAFQSKLVEMVEEILKGVLVNLEEKVLEPTDQFKRAEENKAKLQAQVQRAEESLEKATEDEKKGKEDLAEATRLTLAAKNKQAEQEKLRSEGDAEHEAAKSEKAAIEALLAEELRLLRDGAVEGDEAKKQYKKLEQLAASSGMEDSLLTALPTSMLKPPGDRGSFDAMVVAQLQEGLLKRVAMLDTQIQQGAPAAAERLSRVEEATKEVEASKVHQEKMSEIYLGMQNALKACQDAKKEAEKQVEDAEPMLLTAKKLLEDATSELETYQTFNWGCFEKLRDHSTEKPKAAKEEPVPGVAPSETAVATAGA